MAKKDNIIRVLSFDPGAKNFAYAITEHRIYKEKMQSRVVLNGLILNCPDSPTDFPEKIHKFKEELDYLFEDFLSPEDQNSYEFEVVAERFMFRGSGLSGTTGELSNLALGMLALITANHECGTATFITPSSWKTSYNTVRTKLKQSLDVDYGFVGVSKHQWDAILMGCYRASELLVVKAFSSLESQLSVFKLMKDSELTSMAKLTNRRKKRPENG